MSHTRERIEHVRLLQTLRRNEESPGWTTLRAMRLAARIQNEREQMVIDGLNSLKARYPNDLAFANLGFTLGVIRAVLDGALGHADEQDAALALPPTVGEGP